MSTSSSTTTLSVNGNKRTRKTTTITYRKNSNQEWVEDSKVEVIEEWDESPAPAKEYVPWYPQQPLQVPSIPYPPQYPTQPQIWCSSGRPIDLPVMLPATTASAIPD